MLLYYMLLYNITTLFIVFVYDNRFAISLIDYDAILCLYPFTLIKRVNSGTFIYLFFLCGQLGALHEVLEKLQAKRLPSWEKKFGQVPTV